MKQQATKTKWDFRKIGPAYEGVAVYVPKNRVGKGVFEDEKPTMSLVLAIGPVKKHWKNGMMVATGKAEKPFVILNRHFYDINGFDMGTTITATVQVKEKFSPDDSRKFLLLDITKTSGPRKADLKFSADGTGPIIPGTNTRINIVERPPYEERQRQAS